MKKMFFYFCVLSMMFLLLIAGACLQASKEEAGEETSKLNEKSAAYKEAGEVASDTYDTETFETGDFPAPVPVVEPVDTEPIEEPADPPTEDNGDSGDGS